MEYPRNPGSTISYLPDESHACSPHTGWSTDRCGGVISAVTGRAVDENTLARRRLVPGNEHPGTLISANNLAADQRALGEPEEA